MDINKTIGEIIKNAEINYEEFKKRELEKLKENDKDYIFDSAYRIDCVQKLKAWLENNLEEESESSLQLLDSKKDGVLDYLYTEYILTDEEFLDDEISVSEFIYNLVQIEKESTLND